MKTADRQLIRIALCVILLFLSFSEPPFVPAASAMLSTPTNLTVDDAGDGVSLKLTWTNPVSNTDVDAFIIYRSTDDLNFQAVGQTAAAVTNYIDSGLTENQSYYYRVGSQDALGNTATPTASVTSAPSKVDLTPGTPGGLTVNEQGGVLHLSWSANTENDLAGYLVYRSEDGINYYSVSSNPLVANQYDDYGIERQKTYYYRISAVDTANHESVLSPEVFKGLAVFASDSNVILNGHFQTDLADWSSGFYQLYNHADNWSDAELTLDNIGYMGSIANAGTTHQGEGKAVKVNLQGNGKKARTTLYQRKLEVAPNGEPVQLSFAWKKNCSCITNPDTKQGLSVEIAKPDSTWVKVWQDSSIGSMNDYSVVENLDVTRYFDQAGTYDIRLIAEQGTAAADASAVNAVHFDEVYLSLPRGPQTPSGLKVEVAKEGSALQLSWPANSEPELEGYNVYRSLDEKGPYTLINSALISGVSYADSGLNNAQTYYYRIKAVGHGVESIASRPVRGVPTWIDPIRHPHHSYTDNTDACASCHINHKGRSANILKESNQTQLCFTCHDGSGSKYNTKAQFTANDTSVHPVAGTVLAPNGSMECSSCHNPHATNGTRNTPREAVGSLAQKSGFDLLYDATAPFTNPIGFTLKESVSKETDLCMSCHSNNPNSPVSTMTTATAKEFNPLNVSGHNTVVDSKSSGFGLYVNGWTATSVTFCADCHGAPKTPDNHQGVHGSPNAGLLKGEFTDHTKADNSNALCFQCHDQSSYGGNPSKDTAYLQVGQTRFIGKTGVSGPLPQVGENLHNFWNATLNKGHLGLACAQCHSAVQHGTGKLPAMLVDSSDPAPYQSYTTDTNVQIFYPADGDWSNKNSCATAGAGCHLNTN